MTISPRGRSSLALLLAMFLPLIAASHAIAQAANNNCGQNQGSFTIPPAGGTVTQPGGTWSNDGSPCSGMGGGSPGDVYYYWTPNSAGPWDLSLCATVSVFDSVLSIHTGCPASNGNSIACNDDGGSASGCGSLSRIQFLTLNSGVPCVIRVANRMGQTSHTFTLTVSLSPPHGACCTATGCAITTQTECPASGYAGDNSTCSPSPCGACCAGGTCAIGVAAGCGAGFAGAGSTCTPNPCGACCNGTTCTITAAAACSGVSAAAGSTCTPNLCGACCTLAGTCALMPATSCDGTFVASAATCAPSPCMGTCCDINGLCVRVERAACPYFFGGLFTTCQSDPCPPIGACCHDDDGACSITTISTCIGGGIHFTFMGTGVGCVPQPCPQPGACCVGTNPSVCTTRSRFNCNLTANSYYAGDGTVCGPIDCNLTGGCCFPNGSCIPGTAVLCRSINGEDAFAGFGVPCTPSPCGTGACCSTTGGCSLTSPALCTNLYLGLNSTCSGTPCADTGACCASLACCTLTTQAACTGTWNPLVPCSPTNPCPPLINDSCDQPAALSLGIVTSGDNSCASGDAVPVCQASSRGVWYAFTPTHHASYTFTTCLLTGVDTVLSVYDGPCAAPTQLACNDDALAACSTSSLLSRIPALLLTADQTRLVRVASYNTDPGGAFQVRVTNDNTLGHCCAGAACTLTDEARCVSPGVFTAGGSCTPNPCTGACCNGTHCTIVLAASCSGSFRGNGTTCGPANNPTTCCPANFNQQGGISVQDIFDFLAAYFSNQPSADFNHSGVLSVQDIFDFLAAYFAGCA